MIFLTGNADKFNRSPNIIADIQITVQIESASTEPHIEHRAANAVLVLCLERHLVLQDNKRGEIFFM